MSTVDATTLLGAWEQGIGQPPLERTLTLLAAAAPERSAEEWAGVSIGERDARLFSVREQLFGDRIEVTAVCPVCGARLQAEFSTRDVDPQRSVPASESLAVVVPGYEVHFRLPTSRDLHVATDPAVHDGRALLLARCIERVCADGTPADASSLPPEVTGAVFEAMRCNDPLADLEVGVSCAACGHECPMVFDIAEHLWGDVADCAERLLREVHLLASAYHWTERDILRLTPVRRRTYLDLVGA